MSRESEIYTILHADGTLTGILTGGIYTGESLGPEGITRETAAAAFDSNGYVKPCALIRQGERVETGDIVDYDTQTASARQIVRIWLYEDRGYSNIDLAATRIRTLLFGTQLAGSFELRPVFWSDRLRDPGALKFASLARIDWQVDSIVT